MISWGSLFVFIVAVVRACTNSLTLSDVCEMQMFCLVVILNMLYWCLLLQLYLSVYLKDLSEFYSLLNVLCFFNGRRTMTTQFITDYNHVENMGTLVGIYGIIFP